MCRRWFAHSSCTRRYHNATSQQATKDGDRTLFSNSLFLMECQVLASSDWCLFPVSCFLNVFLRFAVWHSSASIKMFHCCQFVSTISLLLKILTSIWCCSDSNIETWWNKIITIIHLLLFIYQVIKKQTFSRTWLYYSSLAPQGTCVGQKLILVKIFSTDNSVIQHSV